MTDAETANARLIDAFVTGWMAADFDVAKSYARYLAPNCVHRMSEEHAPLTTAAECVGAMQDFAASGGAVLQADINETIARGPLVIQTRDALFSRHAELVSASTGRQFLFSMLHVQRCVPTA